MNITPTKLEGVFIIAPAIYEDDRGYFFESYNKHRLKEHGIETDFVQDNQSLSKKHVFRGFHLQLPPFAQAKLVRVLSGKVIDVVVDVRKKSPTYLQSLEVELSGHNQQMLYVPEGLLHGFLCLEDDTVFTYKVSNYYHKESESGVRWNDEALKVDLLQNDSMGKILVSEKDVQLPSLEAFSEANPF